MTFELAIMILSLSFILKKWAGDIIRISFDYYVFFPF